MKPKSPSKRNPKPKANRKKAKIETWQISEDLRCGVFGSKYLETNITFVSEKPMNKTKVKNICKLLNFKPYKQIKCKTNTNK